MAQEGPAPPMCEVIILTALPIEFQAVLAHLQETREIIHPQGTIYRVGSFARESDRLQVAVAQIGMGGGSAAVETERAIHFFRPHLLFFVGIAGGLKDVQLSDVVLPLLRVDKSINLCKYPSDWFFRHGAARTGHLILE